MSRQPDWTLHFWLLKDDKTDTATGNGDLLSIVLYKQLKHTYEVYMT